jgi:septal ring factor EnvC (AmiA/AmiB activator)
MEPYEENLNEIPNPDPERSRPNRLMVVAIVALLGVAGIASSYAVHETSEVQQLTDQTNRAKVETSQLQAQVNTLTSRLNDLTAAQSANASGKPTLPANTGESNDLIPPPVIASSSVPNPSPAIAPTGKPVAPKHTVTKRRPKTDKRYDQLKAQLDDEQKQLKDTQDQVAKNRSDLEGSISSTRDELNGSIAKTHDELVALEKRGERSYFEFDLTKSKAFQRIGPMSLSLRKSDTKHKNYDLAMLVDDNELNKKKINLYEPVWIHADAGQPVQVVVNHIAKDEVRGYISAPKYKESELPALSSSSSAQAPNGSQPSQQ